MVFFTSCGQFTVKSAYHVAWNWQKVSAKNSSSLGGYSIGSSFGNLMSQIKSNYFFEKLVRISYRQKIIW